MTTWQKIGMGLSLLALVSCSTGYHKDGKAVYYFSWNEGNGQRIDTLDANPATFKVLRYDNYAKDDRNVYFQSRKIDGADAASFEVIGEYYARDKNKGYADSRPVTGSDGRSFRVINPYYSTDGKDCFFGAEPLHVADAQHFRFVYGEGTNDCWTTDGKYYYYGSFKIPSEDYANTTIYEKSGGIAKDSRWAYFLNRKLNFDMDGKKLVDTIDIASFISKGFLECRDKYSCFNVFHGRVKCDKR
jgi:hypothetical protein